MTTREKIEALSAELRQMSLADCDESTRGLIEMFQIIQGLGYDPLAHFLPQSDAEADLQVDALIALLFQIRGDDLPPFDLQRHMVDATAADAS